MIITSCLGISAFLAQRSSNAFGRYLTIFEYRGGRRNSLLNIPKEVEGKGWRKMAMELCGICGNVGKIEAKEYRGADNG